MIRFDYRENFFQYSIFFRVDQESVIKKSHALLLHFVANKKINNKAIRL